MRVIALLVLLATSLAHSESLTDLEFRILTAHRLRKIGPTITDIFPIAIKAAGNDWYMGNDEWKVLRGEIIQIVPSGGVLVLVKERPWSRDSDYRTVYVKNSHYDRSGTDGDAVLMIAKEDGRHSYLNTQGANRTVEAYDYGATPTKEEIDEFRKREAENKKAIEEHLAKVRKTELERREAQQKAKKIQTDSKVIEFQTKRAEEGSAQAQYDLGIRYLKGDGVEANKDTAKKWLEKAAEQDHTMAKKKLEEVVK